LLIRQCIHNIAYWVDIGTAYWCRLLSSTAKTISHFFSKPKHLLSCLWYLWTYFIYGVCFFM
jgi:hypothetical protein